MTLWNFTIDDTSPYLSYSPYGDGLLGSSSGWQTWYTVSQFNTVRDQPSRGDSYHLTSSSNANVTLQFVGTGVALFGFTNSSFDVVIDSGPRATVNTLTTSSSLLYSNYGLTNELHSVTLSARPSHVANSTQILAFDFAITSIPLESNENPPSPLFFDSSNTASLRYSGAWAAGQQDGVPNATASAPFQKTNEVGASMSFSFTGANAVAVKGLATSENGIYSVSMDGSTRTFNGSSLWIIPDALLYFRAGLDANSTHELNITNLSSRLCLNSIMIFKHEPRNATSPGSIDAPVTKPHFSTKIGVIIGSVLGCLFFIIIGIFILYCRRNSQQTNRFKIGRPSVSRKLTFSKPKRKPVTPHSSQPNTIIINPMLATLRQGSRSTSDAGSAYNASDTHSSSNLLNSSWGFGRRSLRSVFPSEAASLHTRGGQMNYLEGWEGTETTHTPAIMSQASSGRTDSSSQSSNAHRMAIQVAARLVTSSSTSEIGSSCQSLAIVPEYIPMSSRKPLPTIPLPSYDTALLAPELTSDDVKHMSDLQLDDDDHGLNFSYAAPPRYERC